MIDHHALGEGLIDDLLILLIHSTPMGNIDLVNNRPDYSFRIFSSQSDYTLIRREIWLLDDETSILGVLDDDT